MGLAGMHKDGNPGQGVLGCYFCAVVFVGTVARFSLH